MTLWITTFCGRCLLLLHLCFVFCGLWGSAGAAEEGGEGRGVFFFPMLLCVCKHFFIHTTPPSMLVVHATVPNCCRMACVVACVWGEILLMFLL